MIDVVVSVVSDTNTHSNVADILVRGVVPATTTHRSVSDVSFWKLSVFLQPRQFPVTLRIKPRLDSIDFNVASY